MVMCIPVHGSVWQEPWQKEFGEIPLVECGTFGFWLGLWVCVWKQLRFSRFEPEDIWLGAAALCGRRREVVLPKFCHPRRNLFVWCIGVRGVRWMRSSLLRGRVMDGELMWFCGASQEVDSSAVFKCELWSGSFDGWVVD